MLTDFATILADADKKGYAVPAFNVYNMETVLGAARAADKLRAPVILQFYSRLATTGLAGYLCPIVKAAAQAVSVPVCLHLDHGSGYEAAAVSVANGATGVMLDFSERPLDENIACTARAVTVLSALGIGTEGELGHIGKAADGTAAEFTDPDEAARYVRETGVTALAVQVGTAHGRYKQAPRLAVDRIAAIKSAASVPLVLHGGSGVPDDQVRAAIGAGIRKVNFGTDLCYAFLDGVFAADRSTVAIDLFMRQPTQAVETFCAEKIRLLGADGRI